MGYTELTEQFERREKMRGTALTILGGVFWGLAGVFGKYSFEHRGMTPQWLVNVRLIIAGLILLSTVVAKQKKDTCINNAHVLYSYGLKNHVCGYSDRCLIQVVRWRSIRKEKTIWRKTT